MDSALEGRGADRSKWQGFVRHPLVAMLIASLSYLVATAIGIALAKLVPVQIGKNWVAIAQAALVIAPVLIVYKLVIAKLGERPRDDLLWTGDSGKNLGSGLLAGFLIMAGSVGIAAALGVYRIVGEGNMSRFVPELMAAAIMPGFMEEMFFRGILFRWLEEFAGSWAGLVLSSLAFGFAHYFNPESSVLACLWIAVEAGVLLGGAYLLTRSLWLPMGLHAAWNFTQGEIFDVPVSGVDEHGLVQAKLSGPALLSGGQFGLEASVIALVLATAAGIWFVWAAVRRGCLLRPRWVRRRQLQSTAV